MANNRMFLVFNPTGEFVYLGKRMAFGWYGVPDDLSEKIMELFSKAESGSREMVIGGRGSNQDDFCLAMEFSSSRLVSECNHKHFKNGDEEKSNGLM